MLMTIRIRKFITKSVHSNSSRNLFPISNWDLVFIIQMLRSIFYVHYIWFNWSYLFNNLVFELQYDKLVKILLNLWSSVTETCAASDFSDMLYGYTFYSRYSICVNLNLHSFYTSGKGHHEYSNLIIHYSFVLWISI